MKKKLLVIAAIAICASMVGYGTLAYFTYEDTATNIITAGDIQIELEYLTETEDGSLTPCEDVVENVLPGMAVSRILQVKNTSKNDAWIRVAVDKSLTLAEGVEGEVDLSLVTLNLNTEYWAEQDGYYYYLSALKPGATTEPLFTTVTFSTQMSNLYQHGTAVIKANAQATQVTNNGSTVLEAAGWPAAE